MVAAETAPPTALFREKAWCWFENSRVNRELPERGELRALASEIARAASEIASRAGDPRTSLTEVRALRAQLEGARDRLRGHEAITEKRLRILGAIGTAKRSATPDGARVAMGLIRQADPIAFAAADPMQLKKTVLVALHLWSESQAPARGKRGPKRTGGLRITKSEALRNLFLALGDAPPEGDALATLWYEFATGNTRVKRKRSAKARTRS